MVRRTVRLRPSMIDSPRGSRRPTSEQRGGSWMSWSSRRPRLEFMLPQSQGIRSCHSDEPDGSRPRRTQWNRWANRLESSALAMPKRPGRSPLLETEFLQKGDVVDARDEVVKANPQCSYVTSSRRPCLVKAVLADHLEE